MNRLLAIGLILALLLGTSTPSARGALPYDPIPPARSFAPTRCAFSNPTADLLAQVDLTHWSGWVRKLSGAEPLSTGGPTITTRYSPYLFNGVSPAYEFVKEQISIWYPGQVTEFSYPAISGQTWKNLILNIPGAQTPKNIVLLTAHLDSTAPSSLDAPGADDNATGSATLLEAARVLQANPLPNTVRMIWFTGEEQGLWGSQAYANAVTSWAGVIGVVNVDMIGYDGNADRCLELHVGTLPASNIIGNCFVDSIEAYNLDLKYDYLTTTAIRASDHASFWSRGIGAIEVLENYRDDGIATGCIGRDPSPNYHQASDTFSNLTLPYSFDVARAALATTFSLARLPFYIWYYLPFMKN